MLLLFRNRVESMLRLIEHMVPMRADLLPSLLVLVPAMIPYGSSAGCTSSRAAATVSSVKAH